MKRIMRKERSGGFTLIELLVVIAIIASPPWRLYRKLSDIIDPGASSTVLFADMREDYHTIGLAIDSMRFPQEKPSQRYLKFLKSEHPTSNIQHRTSNIQ
jgi:prepilin-type N-terminal cleavage/methylation domain-containing protein